MTTTSQKSEQKLLINVGKTYI